MATTKNPIFLGTPEGAGISFANADGTTAKTLFTAGINGGAITQVTAVSDDTVDRIAVISFDDGTTSFKIGEVTIAAGAGTNGNVAAVNIFDITKLPNLDADGSYILKASTGLEINMKVAVTAAKTIDIVAVAGNYDG